MKLSQKMQESLNRQINNELFSSYLYISMSAYFSDQNLHGFAHWVKTQAKEELEHAMKIFDYVNSRGGKVVLLEIEKPASEWSSPSAAFENILKHEQEITELINGLVSVAESEKDKATQIFLDWFITEQVEEEAVVEEILYKIKLVGNSNQGLLMLDHELSQRK